LKAPFLVHSNSEFSGLWVDLPGIGPARKHQFTQPQVLAILCLMRNEDWTFREAEVRLWEHSKLRAVLWLSSLPDYTTVYRFLWRLPDDTIESVLGESTGCGSC